MATPAPVAPPPTTIMSHGPSWSRRRRYIPARFIRSDENLFYHISGDTGEPRVHALESYGEPFMVHAQQVQHRGVEIVHADGVFLGGIAEVVGASVGEA